MGKEAEKKTKTILDPTSGGDNLVGALDPGGTIIKETTGSSFGLRTARKLDIIGARKKVGDDPELAKEEARKAKELETKLARARQKEAARLAAAESDVAERRAAGGPGKSGRSLLIATSPTGTRAQSLGGA